VKEKETTKFRHTLPYKLNMGKYIWQVQFVSFNVSLSTAAYCTESLHVLGLLWQLPRIGKL
jgi:hypothetical protein